MRDKAKLPHRRRGAHNRVFRHPLTLASSEGADAVRHIRMLTGKRPEPRHGSTISNASRYNGVPTGLAPQVSGTERVEVNELRAAQRVARS